MTHDDGIGAAGEAGGSRGDLHLNAALLGGTPFRRFRFGQNSPAERQLKITIPENLDYDGLFDDLLNEYTLEHELIRVRTTNMGTLYELTYNIRLRGKDISKDFIDALRCRNGNLTVSCGREADRDMM